MHNRSCTLQNYLSPHAYHKDLPFAFRNLLILYICCAPSSDLPSLKTGLPHLPTKPWSEDGVQFLRLGRSEDGAGGQKMGQGRKTGQVIQNICLRNLSVKLNFLISDNLLFN